MTKKDLIIRWILLFVTLIIIDCSSMIYNLKLLLQIGLCVYLMFLTMLIGALFFKHSNKK